MEQKLNNTKNSSKKVKKKKKSKIVYVWIILIALIIFLLNKRNKSGSITGNSFFGDNKQSVQAYVEENYLDADILPNIIDMLTNEDRIRLATIYINKENGSRLKEIPLEMVEEKYKYIFGEDLVIENTGFIMSTGYMYKGEEEKFVTLEDYQEPPVEDSANNSKQGNEAEGTEVNEGNTEPEMLNEIMITDCKTGKGRNEYVVTIKQISPKPAIEFYNYANTHEGCEFDTKKLAKMAGMVLPDDGNEVVTTNEGVENADIASTEASEAGAEGQQEGSQTENESTTFMQEDKTYLMSLINESNEEELAYVDYTLELTVREQEGRYVIVDREVQY